MSDLGGTMNENLRDKIADAILANFNPPDDKHSSWWINPDRSADAVLEVVGPELDRLRAEVANLRAALAKVDAVRSEMLGLQASGASLVSRQWVIYRLDAALASVPEPSDSGRCPGIDDPGAACTCFALPEPSGSEPAPDADREAAVVLDAETLTPQGVLIPCPSSAIAILGVPGPVRVSCGHLRGHDGDHEFRVTWGAS